MPYFDESLACIKEGSGTIGRWFKTISNLELVKRIWCIWYLQFCWFVQGWSNYGKAKLRSEIRALTPVGLMCTSSSFSNRLDKIDNKFTGLYDVTSLQSLSGFGVTITWATFYVAIKYSKCGIRLNIDESDWSIWQFFEDEYRNKMVSRSSFGIEVVDDSWGKGLLR